MTTYVVGKVDQVRRPLAFIEREGLLISCIGVYATMLVWRLSSHLQQDSWLALTAGREIARGGIPSHDRLTVWSSGVPWVDQQWLAHLALYALTLAGGVVLALLAHALLLGASFAAAVAAARWRGGSIRATAWVTVLALVPIIQGSWQLRAQTFAYPLFVGLLWLLIADGRKPSKWVFLSLPVLVLWASLHGSVVVGSALVALRGLTCRDSKLRGIALLLGCAAAPLVTPYGVSILSYYRDTLLNPEATRIISEWQPTTLSPWTIPVYVLIAGGIWLLGRHGKSLTAFEQLTFVLTAGLAVVAIRNLAWFGLAALVILPAALGQLAGPERPKSRRALNAVLAIGSATAVLVSIPLAARKLPAAIDVAFPSRAAGIVATAATEDPSLRIFADLRFGNWLLWERPELAGRILYDVRFDLLSRAELTKIYLWSNQATPSWKSALDGSELIVLDPETSRLHEREILREPGARRIYRDPVVSVISRIGQKS